MKYKDAMSKTAKIYWAAISKYQEVKINKPKTKIEKQFNKELESGLKWIIKHIGKIVPPNASKKALEIATANGINLFVLKYDDQISAERKINKKANGREIFHHEHRIDLKTLFKNILAASSEKEIFDNLMKQEIVWITKKEDKMLKKTDRGAIDYYAINHIEVVKNPNSEDLNLWFESKWDTNMINVK